MQIPRYTDKKRKFEEKHIFYFIFYLFIWVNIEEKIDGINNPEYEYVKDTNGDSLTSKVSAKDTMYVSAIQELLTKIKALETRVKELEKD